MNPNEMNSIRLKRMESRFLGDVCRNSSVDESLEEGIRKLNGQLEVKCGTSVNRRLVSSTV